MVEAFGLLKVAGLGLAAQPADNLEKHGLAQLSGDPPRASDPPQNTKSSPWARPVNWRAERQKRAGLAAPRR
eukprot:9528873-Alexandrium_andersonii.AAC.1